MICSIALIISLAASIIHQTPARGVVGSPSPGYSTGGHGESGASSTTVSTGSFTVGGANKMLIATVGFYGSGVSVTSIGTGSQTFTALFTTNLFDGNGKAAIYFLTAPTDGSTSVTLTLSGASSEKAISCILVTNVSTITLGAAKFSGVTDAATWSTSITANAVDLVGDGVAYITGPGVAPSATGTSQTVRNAANNAASKSSATSSTMPGSGGTTTPAWSVPTTAWYSVINYKLVAP